MSAPVLVGYATRSGSTQEVAEVIAEVLREAGLDAELQPVKKVRAVEEYSACVLGAPLYMFRWHRDMKAFLSRNHKALQALPLAIFALGPFHNKEEELRSAREQLDKELAKYAWLKPAAIEVFVGKFDPAKLGFPLNLLPAMKQMPASDERDWVTIRAWAKDLAGKLPSHQR